MYWLHDRFRGTHRQSHAPIDTQRLVVSAITQSMFDLSIYEVFLTDREVFSLRTGSTYHSVTTIKPTDYHIEIQVDDLQPADVIPEYHTTWDHCATRPGGVNENDKITDRQVVFLSTPGELLRTTRVRLYRRSGQERLLHKRLQHRRQPQPSYRPRQPYRRRQL